MIELSLTAEQSDVVQMAEGLAKKHASDPNVTWDEAGTFSWEFLQDLAAHDLTGINLPESQGGQGLSLLDSVLVIDAVGRKAPHLADAVHATNFGAIRQISAFANQYLIDNVLSALLSGKGLPSIAMSEPGAGSAVTHLTTKAVVSGSTVRVTGEKIFNTHGPIATHYVVWARFAEGKDGIGAVVVPADSPGFSRGPTERFLSGEMYCSLVFDNAEVSTDCILMNRNGPREMMSVFNIERLGNATRSLALGELALQLATGYVLERTTGGNRIADFQGIRWKLADTRMQLDAARLLIYRAATNLKDTTPDPLDVSIAKCVANEAGFNAADTALQIHGGYGYSTQSPIGYIWRRTRGWKIAGGSTEILRNRIASEMLKRYEPI